MTDKEVKVDKEEAVLQGQVIRDWVGKNFVASIAGAFR